MKRHHKSLRLSESRGDATKVDRPIAAYISEERTLQGLYPALTIILRTWGCSRARAGNACTMCGFIRDCVPIHPSTEQLLAQIDNALSKLDKLDRNKVVVKLYTSGSFFNPKELSPESRDAILHRLASVEEMVQLIVETRCEFVNEDVLAEALTIVPSLSIAVGLESSSDEVRQDCVGKGMKFSEYVKACKICKALGIGVKTYLLLKPPLLSEREAMEDILSSIRDIVQYTDVISINLCNVQHGTVVERLWEREEYRPPWLWSAVNILLKAKEENPEAILMSDPVGAGSERGPHNCGRCDRKVAEAIKSFSITQDVNILYDIIDAGCDCLFRWKLALELDHMGYGTSLF